ncbi:MAG: hypothetical protein BCS36_11485 [Desulfovibrio sp. MES5]|nr:MAG: hypothetical protein BCS36_11485 [Desulfovibrio sp. MES5]
MRRVAAPAPGDTFFRQPAASLRMAAAAAQMATDRRRHIDGNSPVAISTDDDKTAGGNAW